MVKLGHLADVGKAFQIGDVRIAAAVAGFTARGNDFSNRRKVGLLGTAPHPGDDFVLFVAGSMFFIGPLSADSSRVSDLLPL